MSQEQWERYRATGIYGTYRVALRRLPQLTADGDGWRLGEAGTALADYWSRSLGKHESLPGLEGKQIHGKANPDTYWRKTGWSAWDGTSSRQSLAFLPQSYLSPRPLPLSERHILRSVLFGDDSEGARRRRVAELMAAGEAPDHSSLCSHLSRALPSETAGPSVSLLGQFTQFADAALWALESTWELFRLRGYQSPSIPLGDAVRNREVERALEEARRSAETWRVARGNVADPLPLCAEVDQLAERLTSASAPTDCLEKLIEHHSGIPGGLRWMRLNAGKLCPVTSTANIGVSPYRFRLRQLAQLSVQCGISRTLPPALLPEPLSSTGEEEDE